MKVKQLREDDRQRFDDLMRQLSQIVDKIIKELENLEDKDNLLSLVNQNQSVLAELGVSTKEIDEIQQIALEEDSASKLTGAGGGGCCLVFVPKGKSLKTIQKKIEKKYRIVNKQEKEHQKL